MARVYFRRRKGDRTTRKEAPKHGTWHLDYRDARGERVQPKTSARTKSEAEERLREALQDVEDIRNERKRPPGKPTLLREAAVAFIASRRHSHSFEGVEISIRVHAVPLLGDKYLSRITALDIEEFGNQLMAGHHGRKPLMASSARRVISHVGLLFSWAKRANVWVGESPLADAMRPRLPKRIPKTLKDVQRFLAHAGEWFDLFFFALATGLREGEVVALQWVDLVLDGDEPHAHVRRSLERDITKGGTERLVPLQAPVVELLRHRMASATSKYVWPREDGTLELDASQRYNAAFRRIAVAAGLSKGIAYTCECGAVRYSTARTKLRCACGLLITKGRAVRDDCTFRHFRSTYATALKNPEIARQALGHSSLSMTTGHYYAVSVEDVRMAANALPFVRRPVLQMRDAGVTPETRPRRVKPKSWDVPL